jgi:hypothetical protein
MRLIKHALDPIRASGQAGGIPSVHVLGWAIQSSWTNGGRSGLLPRPIIAIFEHFLWIVRHLRQAGFEFFSAPKHCPRPPPPASTPQEASRPYANRWLACRVKKGFPK